VTRFFLGSGSFGAFQLRRLQSWVTNFNLDGIFLDFYGDTTDIDVSRSYEQLPFCNTSTRNPPLLVKYTNDPPLRECLWSADPMQVAEVQFAKAIATWAHANGKYFIINCPAASMAVQHLADLVTCDSNGVKDHWSMGSRLVSLAYGKRHLLLPNLGPPATSDLWLQHGLRSLFYAEVPCMWQPGAPGRPTNDVSQQFSLDAYV
jgi:hypothetical protein